MRRRPPTGAACMCRPCPPGAGQLVCTGALTDYDVTAALDDVLYYASNGYSPTLVFR